MTQLEKVAFATCSSEPCICKHRAGFEGTPCLGRARAAAEAMREPDKQILARIIHPLNAGPFNQFEDTLRKYIDAILIEKG